jgi:hypothetical protein
VLLLLEKEQRRLLKSMEDYGHSNNGHEITVSVQSKHSVSYLLLLSNTTKDMV